MGRVLRRGRRVGSGLEMMWARAEVAMDSGLRPSFRRVLRVSEILVKSPSA